VVHACNPTSGGWRFKASWGKIIHETLSQKKKKNHKKGPGEWLKVEALSSNSSTTKKKKIKGKGSNFLF
jgi:hypothetical protein